MKSKHWLFSSNDFFSLSLLEINICKEICNDHITNSLYFWIFLTDCSDCRNWKKRMHYNLFKYDYIKNILNTQKNRKFIII